MKDVIVYRCGKVVADGVVLSHVRAVDPPTHQPKGDEQLGSISLDITGTLTYSPLTYANAPAAPAPVPPHVPSNTIRDMYQNGKINYGSYRELCTVMGVPAPPPPPEHEHPDTTRVRKVTERIIALYKGGALSDSVRGHLLDLLT